MKFLFYISMITGTIGLLAAIPENQARLQFHELLRERENRCDNTEEQTDTAVRAARRQMNRIIMEKMSKDC